MSKISYDDKVTLKELPNIQEIHKVTADNMNEIKSVVNENSTKLDNINCYVDNNYNNATTFDILIKHKGISQINSAIVSAGFQWFGIITVGNNVQLWTNKLSGTLNCTAKLKSHSATEVVVTLDFGTEVVYGGIRVISFN